MLWEVKVVKVTEKHYTTEWGTISVAWCLLIARFKYLNKKGLFMRILLITMRTLVLVYQLIWWMTSLKIIHMVIVVWVWVMEILLSRKSSMIKFLLMKVFQVSSQIVHSVLEIPSSSQYQEITIWNRLLQWYKRDIFSIMMRSKMTSHKFHK